MTLTRGEVQAIVDRLQGPVRQAARDLIASYFGDKSKCLASIPARPDVDADLVLTVGIKDAVRALLSTMAKLDEAEAERARLAAANAQLEARVAGLAGFIAEFADAKIEALRFPGVIRSPEDEPDPVVEATEVWAWQEDARTTLAAHGKEPT